jgi:hypothetical protein
MQMNFKCLNDKYLDPKVLRKYFSYHPSGHLSRKFAPTKWHTHLIGKIINGRKHDNGYLTFKFMGQDNLRLHRAIFALVNGYLPEEIDHINGDRADNRIENLREIDRTKNNLNRKNKNYNKTGVPGMYFSTNGYWTGRIRIYGMEYTVRSKMKSEASAKLNKLRNEKLREIGL